MGVTAERSSFKLSGIPPLLILLLFVGLCCSQANSLIQRSPFDIDIVQISNTQAKVGVLNVAKVEVPENTQFLWYYSPTRDPIAWMLMGVGESMTFNYSRLEANGLLNLTVIYPNSVHDSVTRPLQNSTELEVDAFANGVMLRRGPPVHKIALIEGDEFFFECVFRGTPTNLKIKLPDEVECKDQSLDAKLESIVLRCANLHFRKGQYGCEGQSKDKKLLLTVYLDGNVALPGPRYTRAFPLILTLILWRIV